MIPLPLILRVLPIVVRLAIEITKAIKSDGDGERLRKLRAAVRRGDGRTVEAIMQSLEGE